MCLCQVERAQPFKLGLYLVWKGLQVISALVLISMPDLLRADFCVHHPEAMNNRVKGLLRIR